MLIARGKATRRELEEYYSLEDALDLYEVVAVTDFNERRAMAEAQRK